MSAFTPSLGKALASDVMLKFGSAAVVKTTVLVLVGIAHFVTFSKIGGYWMHT